MPAPVKTVFLTTIGQYSYTIPSDFKSLVSVEAIGGGGAGAVNAQAGGGGGGGAYAKSTTMSLTANQTCFVRVGVALSSWFNPTANASPTLNLSSGTSGVLAAAGGTGTTGNSGAGGAGGTVANSTGDLRYAGGNGGTGGPGPSSYGGAGGGAAGPGGIGGNGGNAVLTSPSSRNGGGGSGATLTVAGTNGVSGTSGVTGAGGASAGQTSGTAGDPGGPGSNGGGGGGGLLNGGGRGGDGTYWTSLTGATAGSGGGAGGSTALGGLYGGGDSATNTASSGTQGIIVFTYYARVGSGFEKPDDVFGTIDLDDQYVTDQWLVDKYVGGTLFAWGVGAGGALGLGNIAYYSSPIQVGSLASWSYVSASSFQSGGFTNYSTAIKNDGTLWSWGVNGSGQLGVGNTTSYSSPVQVGALTNWKQTSTGILYCLAIKTDGTLWAWGSNSAGQLGNNNITSYSSPIQIGALNNWKQVSANKGSPAVEQSSAAVKLDGTLWVWGSNKNGALGTAGVNNYYSSPIQVGALNNWKQVSSAFFPGTTSSGWMASVKTDGTLWTWGYNAFGQLGNGNRTYYSSPIQIGALNNWKQVYAGGQHCLAIKTDGTLWAWGSNSTGQLGNGTVTSYSSPIQIGTLTNWKQVSTNYDGVTASTLAIKTDGTLWAWGGNALGQLGQNYSATTSYYSSPIQVGSLTNWKYVSFGGNHVLGITFTDLN